LQQRALSDTCIRPNFHWYGRCQRGINSILVKIDVRQFDAAILILTSNVTYSPAAV